VSKDLAADAEQAVGSAGAHLRAHQLQAALLDIWGLVNRANQFIEQTQPFKLAKDPSQAGRVDQVLYSLVETCRVLAVLLWPFLPSTATKIYAQLGLAKEPNQLRDATWGLLPPGHKVGEPVPLFPRKDLAPAAPKPA
jgi:methionyl-tRNA synthetase